MFIDPYIFATSQKTDNPMPLGHFSLLPLELILQIVKQLAIKDIFNLKATCQSFQIVIESDYLFWQPFVLNYLAKINSLPKKGLVSAVLNEYASLVRFLIANEKLNINTEVSEKKSIFDVALEGENSRLAMLLCNLGATVKPSDLNPAASNGHYAVTQFLLSQQFDPNLSEATDCSETPIIRAVHSQHLSVLMLLHQAGASLESCDGKGRTPLMIAADNKNYHILQYLLKNNVNVNYTEDRGSGSPLSRVILWKDSIDQHPEKRNPIIRALLEAGALLRKDELGECLVRIVALGDIPNINAVLAQGADINFLTSIDGTPLIMAVWQNKTEIVEYLLEKGANLYLGDNRGRTPLIYASRKGNFAIVQLLIEWCMKQDGEEGVKKLVRAKESLSGSTALMSALVYFPKMGNDLIEREPSTLQNHFSTIALLLQNGSDPNERDYYDETPLTVAKRKEGSAQKLIALLINHGAKE